MRLSEEELQQYRDEGYTILRGVGRPDINEQLRTRVESLLNEKQDLNARMTIKYQRASRLRRFTGRRTKFIRKIKHLEDDELFRSFMTDERVVEPLVQILGPDIKIFRADLFYKAPKTGWSISAHQDAVYWPVAPIKDLHGTTCNFFYFLDDADPDNGGLALLPGRHQEGPLPAERYDGDNGGERRIDPSCYSESEARYLNVSAGDAVIFHGMLPHFSGRNTSDRVRRALNVSCWSAHLRHTGFSHDIHGHEDPDIAIEPLFQLCGQSFQGCV